jgi:hypothetical protein
MRPDEGGSQRDKFVERILYLVIERDNQGFTPLEFKNYLSSYGIVSKKKKNPTSTKEINLQNDLVSTLQKVAQDYGVLFYHHGTRGNKQYYVDDRTARFFQLSGRKPEDAKFHSGSKRGFQRRKNKPHDKQLSLQRYWQQLKQREFEICESNKHQQQQNIFDTNQKDIRNENIKFDYDNNSTIMDENEVDALLFNEDLIEQVWGCDVEETEKNETDQLSPLRSSSCEADGLNLPHIGLIEENSNEWINEMRLPHVMQQQDEQQEEQATILSLFDGKDEPSCTECIGNVKPCLLKYCFEGNFYFSSTFLLQEKIVTNVNELEKITENELKDMYREIEENWHRRQSMGQIEDTAVLHYYGAAKKAFALPLQLSVPSLKKYWKIAFMFHEKKRSNESILDLLVKLVPLVR